ncbi:MAG: hypothetical protein AAFQ98_11900 [Bacteroidota bacterium]
MKKKLVDILVQIVPVMIGVYLGFIITNWSDSSKRKMQADQLIENILGEVAANRTKIENSIAYHEMIRDSSRVMADPNTENVNNDFFKGTKLANLTHSAFDTGIQTGIINELPIQQIQLLNQIYTVQNAYDDYILIIMQGFLERDFSKEPEAIRSIARYLSVTMTDIVYQEQSLLSLYEKMEVEFGDTK